MDKNEEIYRWVAAWIKGELTPEDEAELACWLKQDPKIRSGSILLLQERI